MILIPYFFSSVWHVDKLRVRVNGLAGTDEPRTHRLLGLCDRLHVQTP
jgi:hypothetical protein